MGFRRAPKTIKGLLAQAAAANTPWRKNIRLENAKLHLRSFKSIGKICFLCPVFRKHLLGEIAPFRADCHGASNRKQIDRTRNAGGFPAANCHFGKNFGNYLGGSDTT
jgi:hypothetical protein